MNYEVKTKENLKFGGLNTKGIFKTGSENQPLVSVITSVFNGGATLEEAIDSVAKQTYLFVEHIIIDANSKDNTITLLEKYSDTIDYWISEPDNGIYCAWNKGLKIARGKWISFLGSDDVLKPNAIADMINIANRSPKELDYISGKTELIKDGKIINVTGIPWQWSKFKKYVCTGHNAALHNKNLYQKIGDYDTSYKSSGDYELLLRIGKNLNAGYADVVTSSMNLGGISNKNSIAFWESYRAQLAHGATSRVGGFIKVLLSILKWNLSIIFVKFKI